MQFKGQKKEKDWQTFTDNNKDFYGNGVVQFSQRWVDLMETEI